MLLSRRARRFPATRSCCSAAGAFHEVQARPFLLAEHSAGRQGNVAAWRREEHAWRLKSAEDAYRAGVDRRSRRSPRAICGSAACSRCRAATPTRTSRWRKVADLTTDARWRYLALLFRAAAYEAGQADRVGARRVSRRARGLAGEPGRRDIGAQPTRRRRTATGPAARKELDALDASRTERERAADPWWAYDFGQAWRIESGARRAAHDGVAMSAP